MLRKWKSLTSLALVIFTIAFKRAIHLSKELKRIYPDSVIIFGNIHPTTMPEEVLSYNHVDIVLKGEGEKSLIELYKCIKKKKISHTLIIFPIG